MLYRAAAVLIVIFWLAMTALLIRKELSPGATELREVPVSHVMKLMFLHGEASDLNLHSDRQMVGQLRFHPQIRKDDGARVLEYSGRVTFTLPGTPRQRVSWAGDFELNRTLEMQSARLQINAPELGPWEAIHLMADPLAKRLRYETRTGGQTLHRGEYALNAEGALTWLREQGIDPALLQGSEPSRAPPPTFRAWQSSIEIHGQRLDTYRVAVEYGGQTLLEFHVNQLGQILQAKSILGYTAAPEDVIP
jgi:hypothetical protein